MTSQTAGNIAPAASHVLNRKRRGWLFLAAYLIGVIIATAWIVYPSINHFSFVLSTFIGAVIFLPYGLILALNWILNALGIEAELILFRGFAVTPANAFASILIGVSYLLCFIIPVAGILTAKPRTFRLLFFSFIALLIINVAGCGTMR